MLNLTFKYLKSEIGDNGLLVCINTFLWLIRIFVPIVALLLPLKILLLLYSDRVPVFLENIYPDFTLHGWVLFFISISFSLYIGGYIVGTFQDNFFLNNKKREAKNQVKGVKNDSSILDAKGLKITSRLLADLIFVLVSGLVLFLINAVVGSFFLILAASMVGSVEIFKNFGKEFRDKIFQNIKLFNFISFFICFLAIMLTEFDEIKKTTNIYLVFVLLFLTRHALNSAGQLLVSLRNLENHTGKPIQSELYDIKKIKNLKENFLVLIVIYPSHARLH